MQAGGYLPNLGPAPTADESRFASQSQVESLDGEIASLRQALQDTSNAAATSGGDDGAAASEALAALGQRLDTLEQAGNSNAQSAEAVRSLQDTVSAARQAADSAGQTATSARDAATAAQQSADQAAQAAAQAQQTAEQAQGSIADTGNALEALTARVSEVEASNQEARVALAAANLKSAIDTGGPFMSQLETYATTAGAGAGDATSELRRFAADGVPSQRELTERWPDARERISGALTPTAPDAPVGDQILSGLRSLVQVRPSGPAPASAQGPDAALSRMDAAMEAGDLQTWQSEWQTLPEAARNASQDFADDVDARLTAQDAVSGTLSAALGSPAPSGAAEGDTGGASAGGSSSGATDTPAPGGSGNGDAPAANSTPRANEG